MSTRINTLEYSLKRFTPGQRKLAVLMRYGFRCVFCGLDFLSSPEAFSMHTVDHIRPKSKGGTHGQHNKQSACKLCNELKAGDEFETLEEAQRVVSERRERYLDTYHRFLFNLPAILLDEEIGMHVAAKIVRQVTEQEGRVPA
jgi:hypothetical protein